MKSPQMNRSGILVEPVLGFKPSSKFKKGPIGILIYVICAIIAFFSLRSAGVF